MSAGLDFAIDILPGLRQQAQFLYHLTLTFRHHSDAQAKSLDEVFTRRDAVDLMLGFGQGGEAPLPSFIELLSELLLAPGNAAYCPSQI